MKKMYHKKKKKKKEKKKKKKEGRKRRDRFYESDAMESEMGQRLASG